jgi:hypothetical protein
MNTVQLLVGAGVGVVTAIVSYRALRDFSTFGGSSLPLAVCSGALATIGVMGLGDRLISLTIPWAALGIAICFLLILGVVARLCARPHHLRGDQEEAEVVPQTQGPLYGLGQLRHWHALAAV